MADAVVGFLARSLLEKAISLAADEISLSWGVNKELKKLADRLELIEALVSDAQSKQLDSKAVEIWLKMLKSIALDARIVLDDYGYEVLRRRIHCSKRDKVLGLFSSSNPLYFRSSIGHKIRDVLSSLDEAYAESNQIGLQAVGLISSLPDLNKANRLTDPFVEVSEIVGRDDDALKVISLLIDSDYSKDLPVVTILGMGGQGKTTLAQLVYKDEKVGSYFDKKVWICVSDDFNVERLLAQILESLTQNTCQLDTREGLVNELKEELKDKTYLLVLDDVWNESRDEWDVMRRCLLEIGGSKGSKVMATTRSEDVASAMRTSGYHRLQILSEDQSLALFERCAFAEGGATRSPELIEIAKRILKKCGGVPLAIKAVGGLLYTRDSELEWTVIERSELWSIGGSGVLSAIKLSYDHLPSLSLKQCFAYCAVYPKDTELEKDILVQHWMAQGFLNPPKGSQLQMEDIGNMYFNVLLKRSLLQEAKNSWTNELTWKMHDLVHDFSLQVSETFRVDVNKGKVGSCGMDVVHLQVKINYYRERLPNSFKSTVVPSNLRTLSLSGYYQHDGRFENFRCLTVLTMKFWNLEKLPKAIGKIKHLRFLDISGTKVCKLPKSIVKLYYLETLSCGGHLSGLPLGFDNLINLRHLICSSDSRVFLIPGLSQMTNIQTVPFFKVDKYKGFQIEELEHLDNLTGELRIFGLENVSGCESASRSKLSNKSRIHTLELYWEKREHDCNDTEVMKGLRPHSHVKILTIDGYQGPQLPSWIILLRYLTKVTLSNLDKCEQLPSFGELPCLQVLVIGSLPILKCIGKEFYGSYSNGAEISIFPALKELRLYNMGGLEEWSDVFLTTPSSAKAFPSLEMVFFLRLPNLSVFPNLGSLPCLQQLTMYACPKLALQPNWNVPDETSISLHSSVNINSNRDVPYLPSLHLLELVYSDKMFCNLNIFAALKILRITGNASLWPKDMRNLINLESLVLSPEKTDSFPLPYSVSTATACLGDIKYPVSLRTLCLRGWSNITSLPDQIQHLKTLRILYIQNCEELEDLPEWLCSMKCLEELSIRECNNLKQFPSAGALKCLSNLKCLNVTACPLLEERYAKEGCPEWHMIAHIPKIVFESCQ